MSHTLARSLSDRIRQRLDFLDRDSLPYSHVELYFWRPTDKKIVNFGDFLSKIVVTQMLATHERSLNDETQYPRRLLSIGSIIHLARSGDVIWGSGIGGRPGQDRPLVNALDIRAVRGPLTRDVLLRCGLRVPEVYGDPAFLLPTLFPGRFRSTRTRPYVFVPNLHDLPLCLNEREVVSPLMSWNKCIDAILEAELVLASSLHGLIVAEAFGIPARYVRLTESESLFKYRDYYLGTGRPKLTFATSIEQGLGMGGESPPIYDAQALADAFPWDLWD